MKKSRDYLPWEMVENKLWYHGTFDSQVLPTQSFVNERYSEIYFSISAGQNLKQIIIVTLN